MTLPLWNHEVQSKAFVGVIMFAFGTHMMAARSHSCTSLDIPDMKQVTYQNLSKQTHIIMHIYTLTCSDPTFTWYRDVSGLTISASMGGGLLLQDLQDMSFDR